MLRDGLILETKSITVIVLPVENIVNEELSLELFIYITKRYQNMFGII